MIRIQEKLIDAAAEMARFGGDRADIGAVASFIGRVRSSAGDAAVTSLRLEHYAGFTESEIAKIERAARARWELIDVLIIHRFGEMRPGETIVFVAAAAAHRRAALQAVDFIMDYLKTDAPFWKCETGEGGRRWIEPREDDRQARQRWSD